MNTELPTDNLPYAHGGPAGNGVVKAEPEDFRVGETLSFTPSGEGEHVFLRIRKRGENTEFVARQLAKFTGIRHFDVGYAGLKDRHGCTEQWFSLYLPGKTTPDFTPLESDALRVLEITRNSRKLKKGAAAGNRFELVIRRLQTDRDLLEQRLQTVREQGAPNYFGPQRFGRDGQNLVHARELFAGTGPAPNPHRRGLYLSSARSEIFNRILAERVRRGLWNRAIPGDVYMFPDSHSFFRDEWTPEIGQRIAAHAIHPSGSLWGQGETIVSGEAAMLEAAAVAEIADLCKGLEEFGMERAQRPLRICPGRMAWEFPAEDLLCLGFDLPAGAYATVVLRELIESGSLDE